MFRKRVIGGLDLGTFSLKYASVECRSDRIRGLWQAPVFPDRESRDPLLGGELLRKRIETLLASCQKECPSFTPSIVTTIQGEETFRHYLELPVLPEKELEVAVPAETRKYVPLPLDKMSLSYLVVPPLTVKKKRMGVFVIAAPSERVESTRAFLEGLGLNILRIEMPAVSLVREFARNHAFRDSGFRALVHTGFRFTLVTVVRGGYPYFAREFSVGGRDFTYAIQMGNRVSWGEAERYKVGYDVMEKKPALEPFLIQWLDEVKKSVGYFQSQLDGENSTIQEAILSGGTARLTNLAARLQDYLQLPVRTDGWNRIRPAGRKLPETETAPSYKIAVGLALEDL